MYAEIIVTSYNYYFHVSIIIPHYSLSLTLHGQSFRHWQVIIIVLTKTCNSAHNDYYFYDNNYWACGQGQYCYNTNIDS